MFQTIGNNTEGVGLCFGPDIIRSLPICENPWQFTYFSDPPAIFFLLDLYAKD
jgi:hypothetical protein